MSRTSLSTFLCAVFLWGSVAGAVPAQAPTPSTFEVASVKVNKLGGRQVNLNLEPNGRFTATNVTLEVLVRFAYGESGEPLQPNRLSVKEAWVGGVDYVQSDHFDVVAKTDAGTSREQVFLMLRTLLTERFKVSVHHEVRDLPIYALVVARKDGRLGPRLRRSDVDCTRSDDKPATAPAAGTFAAEPCKGLRNIPGKATGRAVTLDTVARLMSGWVYDHRPVDNRTGLTGNFDLDLDWTPDQPLPADAPVLPPVDPDSPSLFTALQEQLGLQLEPAKRGIHMLVVDHAEHPSAD